MKYSKPAKRVELVSIGANRLTIDDLLTVRISPKLKWLKAGIGIGDAGLFPAVPMLLQFKSLGLSNFFEHFDLKSIEQDGLENLQKVGGDGDGHEYVVGIRSQQFYAMWQGERSFEPIARTTKEFLQWVIRERSDHLPGCPWEVFLTKPVESKYVWHRDQIEPTPLLERASEIAAWTREFISPSGFELFSDEQEIDLRFKMEHRGQKSDLRMMWKKPAPRIDSFLRWLKKRGFGRVWH